MGALVVPTAMVTSAAAADAATGCAKSDESRFTYVSLQSTQVDPVTKACTNFTVTGVYRGPVTYGHLQLHGSGGHIVNGPAGYFGQGQEGRVTAHNVPSMYRYCATFWYRDAQGNHHEIDDECVWQ